MPIIVNLDDMLYARRMSSKELAERVGTTPVNISRIKNGQVKGLRFSTLYAICNVLECQPGDILECVFDEDLSEADSSELL